MNEPVPDITPEMLSDRDRLHLCDLTAIASYYVNKSKPLPWAEQAVKWGKQLLKLKEENEQ